MIAVAREAVEGAMILQPGFFDLDDRATGYFALRC